MAECRGLSSLSNETLRDILNHIASDTDRLVNIGRRDYLSQESFHQPSPPSPHQTVNIGNFRLACKRFSELGASYQFSRVTTRFSYNGLERLEAIAERPNCAVHVKKFSYMVPYFYSKGCQSGDVIASSDTHRLDALLNRKVREQQNIIGSGKDERILKKAILAFTCLQHVQILRVVDSEDEELRRDEALRRFVRIEWQPACLRSADTIGVALAASSSPISRLSSPVLSPQSALQLAEHPPSASLNLAARLTCLELHFEDGTDLDARMLELSGTFKALFTAATNMEAIHVGFPSLSPLSLPLASIFHDIHWKKLIAFGIQGWRLDAYEIIALAGRHRHRLQGLRLRDVLLKDGSMWEEVLSFLRGRMLRLDWVSLRRIGYVRHFDEILATAGMEITDDDPGGASDSDDNDDDDDIHSDDPAIGYDRASTAAHSDFGIDSDSEREASDDEHGPHAHEIDFPLLSSPDVQNSVLRCICNSLIDHGKVDDLGDDGISVDNTRRKLWEQWVMRRCSIHPQHECQVVL